LIDDLPLSYLEALDDEFWDLQGVSPAPVSPYRAAYVAAVRDVARAPEGSTKQHRAEEALKQAERDFRHDLLHQFHKNPRAALCFSGGGIRSATFGLGILQGLAAHSRDTGDRPQLLGEFDYLSTVSGGGYLGSWFSAWAARPSADGTNAVEGTASLIRQLAKNPDTGFDPEPGPVRHLRAYSNYLIPKLGLFSADTWAVIGTVLRNMFLNWMVLAPLLALILLIPIAALKVLDAQTDAIILWGVIAAGFGCGLLATAYIGFDLPSAGNARGNYARYIFLCLVPIIASAVLLNTFWWWLPVGQPASWFNIVGLGKTGLGLWHFALFGALMQAGGLLFGILAAVILFRRPPARIGLIATASAVGTGGMGGAAMYGLLQVVPVAVAAAATKVGQGFSAWITEPRFYVWLAFPVVVDVFLLAATLLVGFTSYITRDKDREWWARSGGLLLSVAVAWFVFAGVVLYAREIVHVLTWGLTSTIGAIAAWATVRLGSSDGTVMAGRQDAPAVGQDAVLALARRFGARLALPVFIFTLVLMLSRANAGALSLVPAQSWRAVGLVLGLGALYLLIGFASSYVINVNTFSLHAMYKLRLVRAYLGASNPKRAAEAHPFTGFEESDDVEIHKLASGKPLHVVNMALNLVGGSNLAWQQRKAESFTSTRLHTGSCRVGFRRSKEYAAGYGDLARATPLTLGTAMTISGAAASPNMGYNSSPLLTIVMTLFNARLGWWLGNPKTPRFWKYRGPRYGVRAFIDEALGLTDDTNRWIYLSDGGHFDNLGLYEMVLRRCNPIVICDSGADPDFRFEDLGNAVRKVRVDLGVSIEFSGAMPTKLGENGAAAGPHCVIGTIRYAVDHIHRDESQDGTLIYIKASVTGDEPPDVLHYHSQNPSFPHQTTTDQFFDEAQFESYRRLGLHIIERVCDGTGRVSPPDEPLTLEEFVKRAREYCDSFAVPIAPAAGVAPAGAL
jgi:hypothetical protein